MGRYGSVFSGLIGLVVGGSACGGKGGEAPSQSAPPTSMATDLADVGGEIEPAPEREGGGESNADKTADGMGTVTLAGGAPVGELVLEPLGADGKADAAGAVRPDAKGRVKAGIYKVPGGSFIAVPEGGTVPVRPDETRGVMIGGLPFQLDTEVKLVAESDPEGLSFARDAAQVPDGMDAYGPRWRAPGEKIDGLGLLERRDFIRKLILHADRAADSRMAYHLALGDGLSDHFYVDFDGTLRQALDVGLAAYHAGESNHHSVSVVLNNPLVNLAGTPEAKVQVRVLPDGASPTPPTDAASPNGPCRLEAGTVVCTIMGRAFGLFGDHTLVVGRDQAWSTEDGQAWEVSEAPPFVPNGLRSLRGNLVAYGDRGKVAIFEGQETWRLVALEVEADWRDAWVGLPEGDGGDIVVLVGSRGSIARSTDSGASFVRVESGFAGDFEAIAQLDRGRLVARAGARAIVSDDQGASWKPLADEKDLVGLVPAPGIGRCVERQPASDEVCTLVWTMPRLRFVEAFVQVGGLGLAYTRSGLMQTDDGGLSFEPVVTAERFEELARFERPLSEAMEINGAKVQTHGYTEPQYRTLGSLARLLANVFPALARVGGMSEDGRLFQRTLDIPAVASGVLGHWHVDSNRWDPGPGFDWERLTQELAEPAR